MKFLAKCFARWSTMAIYAILAVATLGMIAFCVYGIADGLNRQGFSSDAAAWAQAGGAVAAIAGAVWISRIESLRDRRQRRREREEIAWAVRYCLICARNEAFTVAHEMFEPGKVEATDGCRHLRTRLRNARLLLQVYASRTDHIHPAFVQVANNAVLLLNEMEGDLDRAEPFILKKAIVPLPVAESIAWYEVQLNTLLNELDSRVEGIRLALNKGGDMLPVEEWMQRPPTLELVPIGKPDAWAK